MARPKSKTELVSAANDKFVKLWRLIDAMPDDAKHAEFDFHGIPNQKEAHWKRDKNLRDVLVHLFEWHQLLLDWVRSNQAGETKPFLPAPYNWKTYGDMNVGFWKKHQCTPFEVSVHNLKESHAQAMDLIDSFTNEALFTKGSFTWTGGSTLGSYCISATASHYDWAIKKMKAHTKTYQQ